MRFNVHFALLFLPALFIANMGAQTMKVTLENAKVKVTEVTYEPGVPRARYIRPTDQVTVFLDNCKYQRTDPKTGEKTVRERKAGDIFWHDKGEEAPVLINLGTTPYRTLKIELKH